VAGRRGSGVAGRGLAADVGDRAGDDDVLDAAGLEQVRQRGEAGEEGAGGELLDDQVGVVHLELVPQPVACSFLEYLW